MDGLVKLLKSYQVGLWCKRGAWIIAIIGLIEIVLDTYAVIEQYNLSDTHLLTPVIFAGVLRFALAPIPVTIFYFLVLYAVGVAINHLLGIVEIEDKREERGEDDDEDE